MAQGVKLKLIKPYRDLGCPVGETIVVSPEMGQHLMLNYPDYFEVVGIGEKGLDEPPVDKMRRSEKVRTK